MIVEAGGAEVGGDVDGLEDRKDFGPGRRLLASQGGCDLRALIFLAQFSVQSRQLAGTEFVVGDDVVRNHVGDGQQEHGDQAGAVAARGAMDQYAAGPGSDHRPDRGRASLGLSAHEQPVVEGRAVEVGGPDLSPQRLVSDVVESNMDRREVRGSGVEPALYLLVVAQVYERPDAVGA